MSFSLSSLHPARLAGAVLRAVTRCVMESSTGWCPAPLEPDERLLRDIGRTRGELTGIFRLRTSEGDDHDREP
jgi:hypothetical protein